MSLNLASIVSNAVKAAGSLTSPATITRNPLPDPVTGVVTGSAVAQTVRVLQVEARSYARASDAQWAGVTTAVFVAFQDCTFTPARGDTIHYAGRTGRVVALVEYTPQGAPYGLVLGIG